MQPEWTTIDWHACRVEYHEMQNGWRCELISADRRTVGSGLGTTPDEARSVATADFRRRLPRAPTPQPRSSAAV